MRPGFLLVIALLGVQQPPEPQGEKSRLLGEILLVEDRRARGEHDVALLLGALEHADPLVVRRAARALGRLERPELAAHLFPLLGARSPAVRADAAQGIAQAAQGFRGDSALDRRTAIWPALLASLRERNALERDPAVRGMLALSLGRLPWSDPAEIVAVRRELVVACGKDRGTGASSENLCRGAETMVRATWRRVSPGESELGALRSVVRSANRWPGSRRHALGALVVVQAVDDTTMGIASRAADPELRRLAVTGVRRLPGTWRSSPALARGMVDPDAGVRLEAVRALGRVAGRSGCPRLVEATSDRSLTVVLVAIDLLSECGSDSVAVTRLQRFLQHPAPSPQHRSHALVALARASPARAAWLIQETAVDPGWQLRMYAARAAAAARDSATLILLAGDAIPNVADAAIAGLKEVMEHRADSLYRQALAGRDYQLLLTAASALAGTPDREAASAALLAALERISFAGAETSRDPRVAILVRLRETGSHALAPRLMPYLEDFDPAVADSAAAVLSTWTGTAMKARPRPLPVAPVTRGEVESLRGLRLHFIMRTGRSFEVELLLDDAPVTVARIVRLVRKRYYDDLTFHRVVPNFVVQGGSPGANEYAGVPAFMRDELSAVTHARGTLGVSTRGRDTGDAQIFINLRDNPRLDYDYTVWGRVISGLATIDSIQEGASILRVEIRSR